MSERTRYIVKVDGEPVTAAVASLATAHRQAARILAPDTLYVITTEKHAVVGVRRVAR